MVRGSLEEGAFTVFYRDGGRAAGALRVGRSEDLDPARALIAARTDVAGRRGELADPSVSLEPLAAG